MPRRNLKKREFEIHEDDENAAPATGFNIEETQNPNGTSSWYQSTIPLFVEPSQSTKRPKTRGNLKAALVEEPILPDFDDYHDDLNPPPIGKVSPRIDFVLVHLLRQGRNHPTT
jgi:hypothetical protein